jgi:hypothetical protein
MVIRPRLDENAVVRDRLLLLLMAAKVVTTFQFLLDGSKLPLREKVHSYTPVLARTNQEIPLFHLPSSLTQTGWLLPSIFLRCLLLVYHSIPIYLEVIKSIAQ